MLDLALSETSAEVAVYLYCCPHCGAALSTDMRIAGTEEVAPDMSLRV